MFALLLFLLLLFVAVVTRQFVKHFILRRQGLNPLVFVFNVLRLSLDRTNFQLHHLLVHQLLTLQFLHCCLQLLYLLGELRGLLLVRIHVRIQLDRGPVLGVVDGDVAAVIERVNLLRMLLALASELSSLFREHPGEFVELSFALGAF